MRLAAGTRLGPYEVVSPLGSGGMGEVYRARDSRLGRDVAVKVLPEHLIAHPEVLTRFEREARAISSLNHPHICTLHDVGREGDVEFLVMELVEGETLSARLERGAMPMPELLRLGIQIADALDRAHRAGIVHRDFKPGNVMITKSGAKLMDFGLARATGTPGSAGNSGVTIAALTQSPTVMSPLTSEGTLVGTFLYMSPEQLEGKEADARSDLWAFGCTLYEMATGRRAFDGKSQASLIGAIMHSEPPAIATALPGVPPALDGLVRACLAKDPEERVQTAHDVKLQLSWIVQSGSQPGVAAPALPPRAPSREPIAWAVAALAVASAVFFAWRSGGARNEAPQVRFTVPVPPSVTTVDMPRISPDGTMLAFSAQDSAAKTMIWLRPLQSLTAHPLPGTEGSRRPFWSPDSRYLAFVSGGKLKKMAVAGGPPEVVCDAPAGFDGTWGRNGDILFDGGDADPLLRVRSAGGVATPAMPADTAFGVGWPAFLPDGKHYFYTRFAGAKSEIMLGTLGSAKGKPLGLFGSRVEYSPDGYLLFARDRTLLAQRFDAGRLKLIGETFPIAEDLPVAGNAQANFTVSNTGVLVYRSTGTAISRLAWLDRAGRELMEVAAPADYRAPALSPHGDRIVIRRRDPESSNLDLWMLEPARGTTTRFTFDAAAEGNPLWSPDGSQVIWSSDRDGDGLWIKSASGLGAEQRILKTGPNSIPNDWTKDGAYVVFQVLNASTGIDLHRVSMRGEHVAEVVLQTPFHEQRARVSPDGRWIAYDSDESGRAEVYVASFQGAAGKWQISTSGGIDAAWSHDGRELFYLSADQRLMSVSVAPGATFVPGTPRELFRVRTEPGRRRNVYCPSPDGTRFLFQLPLGETNTPMTVALNWRGGRERR